MTISLAGSTSSSGIGARTPVAEFQQPAQRRHPLALVVDQPAVLLEDLVLPGAGGVLQLEHGVRVEQVVFAFATPLVFPAHLEFAVRTFVGPVQEGQRVPGRDVGGDVGEVDSAGGTGQPGEVFAEDLLVDADGLEQLGAGVGGQRRDAHLGHHFQHALAGGLDVVLQRRLAVEALEAAAVQHDLDRLERHVRVDRRRTEADQRGHVVHLAGVAGLDDQADLGAAAFADQVVVHGRDGQQRRDRRQLLVGLAVGKNDDPRAVGDRRRGLCTHLVERRLEAGAVLGDRVQTANHLGPQAVPTTVDLHVGVEVDQLGQFVVTQNRLRQR